MNAALAASGPGASAGRRPASSSSAGDWPRSRRAIRSLPLSRSIHTTRSSLRRLARNEFGDPAVRKRTLEKARQELRRKRLIKRAVRAERRREEGQRGSAPADAVPLETIPIEVERGNERVFHALDEGDVRALFRALPDAAEGIRCVRLSSGARYIEGIAGVEEEWTRDPFTGRFGAEMVPGVFAPPVLGLYRPSDLSVHVHAFVLDPARFVLPERACKLLLRLRALSTLMHEVGHHHDLRERTSRGRWLTDDRAKLERHAEGRQDEWTLGFVVPHLLDRHPEDVRALLDWLAERGGARFSLAELVPDGTPLDSSGFEAVLCWLSELADEPDPRAARTSLARELHRNDQFEPCLRVLEALSNEYPDDAEILTLRADTLVIQERPGEALAITEALQARGVDSDDLWRVRCDALEYLGEWTRLLATCDAWSAARDRRGEPDDVACDHRAVAFAALGDFETGEHWLRAWARAWERSHLPPVTLERLRAGILRRLERTARLRART